MGQHGTTFSAIFMVPTPIASKTANPPMLRQIPRPLPLPHSIDDQHRQHPVLFATLAMPRLATSQSPSAISLSSFPTTMIPVADQPVVISPFVPPIPHDLAQKICDNKYVENLKEPEVGKKDKQKEKKKFTSITYIATWVEAFNVFIGVMAITERVPDLATYSFQISRTSRQYEEMPWLEYHRNLRQQATATGRTQLANVDTTIWTMVFGNADNAAIVSHTITVTKTAPITPKQKGQKMWPSRYKVANRHARTRIGAGASDPDVSTGTSARNARDHTPHSSAIGTDPKGTPDSAFADLVVPAQTHAPDTAIHYYYWSIANDSHIMIYTSTPAQDTEAQPFS